MRCHTERLSPRALPYCKTVGRLDEVAPAASAANAPNKTEALRRRIFRSPSVGNVEQIGGASGSPDDHVISHLRSRNRAAFQVNGHHPAAIPQDRQALHCFDGKIEVFLSLLLPV